MRTFLITVEIEADDSQNQENVYDAILLALDTLPKAPYIDYNDPTVEEKK